MSIKPPTATDIHGGTVAKDTAVLGSQPFFDPLGSRTLDNKNTGFSAAVVFFAAGIWWSWSRRIKDALHFGWWTRCMRGRTIHGRAREATQPFVVYGRSLCFCREVSLAGSTTWGSFASAAPGRLPEASPLSGPGFLASVVEAPRCGPGKP